MYQVDAAFTPLVESGWDNVLREAKSASVPLLSIDRAIRGVMTCRCSIGFDYASLAEGGDVRSSACRGRVLSFTAR